MEGVAGERGGMASGEGQHAALVWVDGRILFFSPLFRAMEILLEFGWVFRASDGLVDSGVGKES